MGKSVVGRTGALRLYHYPEPRFGGAAAALARNYATGPKSSTVVDTDGVEVPWNSIDVGPDGTDVPITPLSTGVVLVTGVIGVHNGAEATRTISVIVRLDGVDIPTPTSFSDVEITQDLSVPFEAAVEIPIGEQHDIQIFVTAIDEEGADITLIAEGCVVNVQEVPVSTG